MAIALKHAVETTAIKTTAEINAELAKLKTLTGRLPQFDSFGGNNWSLLKAQIRTLKQRLGMDEILKIWSAEDDAQGAAEDARYWMDGGEVFSPFRYWEDVLNGIKNPE